MEIIQYNESDFLISKMNLEDHLVDFLVTLY